MISYLIFINFGWAALFKNNFGYSLGDNNILLGKYIVILTECTKI